MLVTELGMVTEVRLVQRENALSPMLVIVLGVVMVTEVKSGQFGNAWAPMLFTVYKSSS